MFNPLSHAAFIVLSELQALDNKANVDELKANVEKRGIKGVDTAIAELLRVGHVLIAANRIVAHPNRDNSEKLQPPKNLIDKQAYKSKADISKAFISTAVKGMHAGYQAVVDGKRPRWSAIHAYAERKLSRADHPEYFQMIREMSDDERIQFNRRLARLLD